MLSESTRNKFMYCIAIVAFLVASTATFVTIKGTTWLSSGSIEEFLEIDACFDSGGR